MGCNQRPVSVCAATHALNGRRGKHIGGCRHWGITKDMAANIEQIFRDFVVNKIKEIEDESQDIM